MVDPKARIRRHLAAAGLDVEHTRAELGKLLRRRNALILDAHAAGWTLDEIGRTARPIKPLSKQAVQKIVHSGEKRGT